MKSFFGACLITALSFNSFAQGIVKTGPYINRSQEIQVDKIINKLTGEIFTKEELKDVLTKYKKLKLKPNIDEFGILLNYIFDPNDPETTSSQNDFLTNVEKGNAFPNFIFKTIDDEVLNLQNLRGKTVILRFEMRSIGFTFKQNEISDLDNQINSFGNGTEEFYPIIVFQTSKEEIKQGFNLKETNFKLVSDGWNYCLKYSISRYPTTIIIDKEGKLLEQYLFSDEIVLKDLY
jgi:peroxiredoxin